MRLAHIRERQRALGSRIQELDPADISERIYERFVLRPKEPPRRRLVRKVAPLLVRLSTPLLDRRLPALPFRHDAITLGERFGSDASLAFLLSRLPRPHRVLVPGCYLGAEDVQFWLRRGVPEVDGIDVWSLRKTWDQIVPALERHYGARVRFQQASIERLPFADESFDLITSAAVLEHVRNLHATVDETARVLRPGGRARHEFGPLYYAFGGDHCISSYGEQAGYDHLLLDEEAYQQRINDQAFYDRDPDPNLPFWARREQFSFATPEEYLAAFERRFELEHVLVKISTEGLAFRKAHSDKWRTLRSYGLSESTLLTKTLSVVLRKRA